MITIKSLIIIIFVLDVASSMVAMIQSLREDELNFTKKHKLGNSLLKNMGILLMEFFWNLVASNLIITSMFMVCFTVINLSLNFCTILIILSLILFIIVLAYRETKKYKSKNIKTDNIETENISEENNNRSKIVKEDNQK